MCVVRVVCTVFGVCAETGGVQKRGVYGFGGVTVSDPPGGTPPGAHRAKKTRVVIALSCDVTKLPTSDVFDIARPA